MKKFFYVCVLCLTTLVFSCESDSGVNKNQRLESIAETAVKNKLGENNQVVLTTVLKEIKGFTVPFVSVVGKNEVYAVLIDDNNQVKAILSQIVVKSADGSDKYMHYANQSFVGYYVKDMQGSLIDFNGESDANNSKVANCQAKEGESCTGCHYRVMKEAVSLNGDTQAMCDGLNSAQLCDAAIYTAAAIHCWLSH